MVYESLTCSYCADFHNDIFPELKKEKQLAYNVIKEEEKSFLKTLDQGLVLLEDVITTGGSSLKASKILAEMGCNVVGCITILDREEGGREAFEKAMSKPSMSHDRMRRDKNLSRSAGKPRTTVAGSST